MNANNKTQQNKESLDRARSGKSKYNYGTIKDGFVSKGIELSDIKPRKNVLTYAAWNALGRHVKKGEHGVKVLSIYESQVSDPDSGETYNVKKGARPTVFHISQTESTKERDARIAAIKAVSKLTNEEVKVCLEML